MSREDVEAPAANWGTGLSDKPVFIDGLSHELFYLIVASKNESRTYQAVVIGMFGSNEFKVKMYGTFEEWGFNTGSLADKFRAKHFLSRAIPKDPAEYDPEEHAGYERYMTDQEGVARLLKALTQTQGVTVCPVKEVMKAYNMPYEERKEVHNLLQPFHGGYIPLIPFKAPKLLNFNAVAA
jgi:hypothetical protein